MNRLILLIGGGVIAAVSLFGFSLARGEDPKSGDAKSVTITGELIDAGCFVSSGGDAKGKDHAQCAQRCMASGVPSGILPEGKTKAEDMMILLTNPIPFAPYAAQTIKIEGIPHPDNRAIDVKKAWAKDGVNWKEIQLKDEHHGMGGQDDSGKPHDHGTEKSHDHK